MAVLNLNLKKRLAKIHKPRRREVAIAYIRERVAKLLNGEPYNVVIDTELNRRAQLAARRMEHIKIEATKEGDIIRARWFRETKEATANVETKNAKEAEKNKKDKEGVKEGAETERKEEKYHKKK